MHIEKIVAQHRLSPGTVFPAFSRVVLEVYHCRTLNSSLRIRRWLSPRKNEIVSQRALGFFYISKASSRVFDLLQASRFVSHDTANIGSSRTADLGICRYARSQRFVQTPAVCSLVAYWQAFSDGTYHKESSHSAAQRGMKLAIASAAEIQKPLPFYEIKSAKDPWASFRAAGQEKLKVGTNTTRVAKRGRDESDDISEAITDFVAPTAALQAAYAISDDPNDLEFTNPPW